MWQSVEMDPNLPFSLHISLNQTQHVATTPTFSKYTFFPLMHLLELVLDHK